MFLKCFGQMLGRYFDFKGRTSRAGFWYAYGLYAIIFVILSTLSTANLVFFLIYAAYLLLTLIPVFSITVRRMHDINKSGWYGMIPLYGFILTFEEGDKESNKYGEPDIVCTPKTQQVL